MKKILLFMLSLISFSCTAMDQIMEIKAIENPHSVGFLFDDSVVIAGENGAIIWSLIINKERACLDKKKVTNLTISDDRFNIGLLSKKQLAVFGNAGDRKWKHKPIDKQSALAFNPTDSQLITYNKGQLTFHNYSSKISYTKKVLFEKLTHNSCLACHPAGKEFAYPSSGRVLSSVQLDIDSYAKGILTAQDSIIDVAYSPDGNVIAVNDCHNGCFIYDTHTKTSHYLQNGYIKLCVGMAFHPKLSILALLMTNNAIQYWNYKTKKFVALRLHTVRNHIRLIPITQRLHFSPDGKMLIVAFNDRCAVLRVPQNNIIIRYWLLRKMLNPVPELVTTILQKIDSLSGLYQFKLTELSLT